MNIKKHLLVSIRIFKSTIFFHNNIRADNMLVIGYVAFRCILCRCCACLSKLSHLQNRIQDKYNQYQYKGENQQFFYWPILELYNNWHIIPCIDS